MALTPEGRTKKQIREWLNARGIWHFLPAANGMGKSGIPDFICVVPPTGRILAIEAKAKGKSKNTTALQDMRLQEIRDAGGIALVVDDVTQLEGVLCQ